MPKLENFATHIKVNGNPYAKNTINYQVQSGDTVGLYYTNDRDRRILEKTLGRFDDWTNLNDVVYTSLDALVTDLDLFLFSNTIQPAGTLLDAFGRNRVSNPLTIFDSKQIFDNQPLFWDDQQVSGSGTTSTYSKPEARTRIAVALNTAGKRVRQTFMRFNYQPGKSQFILMTTRISSVGSGITAAVGFFDDNNGLYFKLSNGVIYSGIRTSTSGSPVDNEVAQSSWNVDRMDGTGPSGITLDPTKTQILFWDFEWLGVGKVRSGFVVDGAFYVCHEFLNTNVLSVVYMTTPNLPLRYEIENDGTGAVTSIDHICSTVISEGGQSNLGVLRHKDSGSISSLGTGTVYAILGLRLKSTHLAATILGETISLLAATTNDKAHWEVRFNPTVAGTFTYTDETNSAVQTAQGSAANTVTGGIEIDGGYFSTNLPVTNTVPNALRLGSNIAGTPDTIVLCVRPITNNITVEGSLTWRELQ